MTANLFQSQTTKPTTNDAPQVIASTPEQVQSWILPFCLSLAFVCLIVIVVGVLLLRRKNQNSDNNNHENNNNKASNNHHENNDVNIPPVANDYGSLTAIGVVHDQCNVFCNSCFAQFYNFISLFFFFPAHI
jgi:flagellar biosynthesis/type III secretory pathway M-ring protein FliF/YscJ